MNFNFIKSIICQFGLMLLSSPVYITVLIFPGYWTEKRKHEFIKKYVNLSLSIFGIKIKLQNQVDTIEENCLIIANHANWLDAFILYSVIDAPVSMVVAKEANWHKFPIIGQWMKSLDFLFMDRVNNREAVKTVSRAIDLVKTKCNVGLFPEGKVTLSDEIAPFKSGAFRIAIKGQVPIIPICIKGSKDLYSQSSRWTGRLNKGVVEVSVLPKVTVHLKDKDIRSTDLSKICKDIISSELQENNNLKSQCA